MSNPKLKTYDIASYDIELDFNKQIAPIEKRIQKLNSSHETKSLRAHKDFLSKEQKSQETINQLNDKSVVKNQRIERAVENKLKKIQAKKNRYEADLEEFVAEKTEEANQLVEQINEEITVLEVDEQAQVEEIKSKYKTNIESYVEKLDIYNNNFENNKKTHNEQINNYQQRLNEYSKQIIQFYKTMVGDVEDRLKVHLETKTVTQEDINDRLTKALRLANNHATATRKDANVSITNVNDYVNQLQIQFETHYKTKIDAIDDEIAVLAKAFEERAKLIEKDLSINLTKQETLLEELQESKNRRARKSIEMKIDLFNTRAKTAIQYEQRMMEEQKTFLQQQRILLREQLDFEHKNLEKLRTILINDQQSIKESGDYFKDVNTTLKEQLANIENANNDYVYRHEELKADFVKRYTTIFTDLKNSTIEMAQTYLEKIADNNQEIDDINKFLDTAEPLKEIEVNRLRESIEINEIHERFKIKYAKQQYEIDLINNQLEFDKRVKELETKQLISEYNKEVSEIKNKEVFDKALEKAKLKHSKAQQVYRQRLNNTKLEQKLLESKYETERDRLALHKELAEIDVRKDNALRIKEIEYAIKNYEIEANYRCEVIQKGLEEELLKLDEQTTKVKHEKDAYSSNLNREIDKKKAEINALKRDIEHEKMEKLRMIDKALERELREPTKNKIKTEAIIDERLSKLDVNNAIFVDFINDSIRGYGDDKLSLEQIREVIINSPTLTEKTTKYLSRAYDIYIEAYSFMNDIEIRNMQNKIASTSDQAKIKRYNKNLRKLETDASKNIEQVRKTEQDHLAVLIAAIKEETTTIKRSNPETINELFTIVEQSYQSIFNRLTSIQDQLIIEVRQLYSPLTQHDQELINYANDNAEKAKQKVEDQTAEKIAPLDHELVRFTEKKEQERNAFNQSLDQQINDYKAQINHLKNDALSKIKEINADKDLIVNEKQKQKQDINQYEEQEIVKRYEMIDREIDELTDNYNIELKRLDQKDLEAKKIFDYEDRIHAIAVEAATARFNDANIKIENIHLNNVKQAESNIEQAKVQKEKQEHTFNEKLLELTRSFEKNIFSVRPRLEESIGDAQKEIERQIREKKTQLRDLEQNNRNIIQSAENSLFTAFQEGYDRLTDNLNTYIEKYRLIEQEYNNQNAQYNQTITTNNVQLGTALLELNKRKHQATLENLLIINNEMYEQEGE
jgi:hypothetical protein